MIERKRWENRWGRWQAVVAAARGRRKTEAGPQAGLPLRADVPSFVFPRRHHLIRVSPFIQPL